MKKFLILVIAVFCSFTFYGQTITGVITDSDNNEALIGVNIILTNGSGTATDIFGKYSLQTAIGKQKVTFRYIGYEDIVKEIILTDHYIYVGLKKKLNLNVLIYNATLIFFLD